MVGDVGFPSSSFSSLADELAMEETTSTMLVRRIDTFILLYVVVKM